MTGLALCIDHPHPGRYAGCENGRSPQRSGQRTSPEGGYCAPNVPLPPCSHQRSISLGLGAWSSRFATMDSHSPGEDGFDCQGIEHRRPWRSTSAVSDPWRPQLAPRAQRGRRGCRCEIRGLLWAFPAVAIAKMCWLPTGAWPSPLTPMPAVMRCVSLPCELPVTRHSIAHLRWFTLLNHLRHSPLGRVHRTGRPGPGGQPRGTMVRCSTTPAAEVSETGDPVPESD